MAARTTGTERTDDQQLNFDKMTVQDFINYESKERAKMIKKLAEMRRKEEQKMLQSLYEYEAKLEKQGIQLSESEKKFLLEKEQNDKRKKDKEELLAYYKERGALAKKEREKEEKQLDKALKTYEKINNLMKEAEEAATPEEAKKLEKKAERTENLANFSNDFKKNLSEGFKNVSKAIGSGISELNNAVNNAISTYASYQQTINVRLQGIDDKTNIWKDVQGRLKTVATSPIFKTDELYTNLATLVEEGIASNIEQRAFLQTIRAGIARTFDANDASLKRIIRLQQYDSTAARLGMESYLTQFMNELVKNTEYLSTTFDNVTASLLEASSLLNAQASTEFEYTVQKWLGTLTGVGLSENTAQSIAQAIGYLGSGNISALSGSEMQNLLVMAASRNPNLNYADLLSGGLTATSANQLLGSVVAYLQEIGGNATSNVTLSEMAKIFGVSVSDLVAARNIDYSTSKALFGNMLSYEGMYDTLAEGMRDYVTRTGMPAILENLFGNFTSTAAANIASSSALYSAWKITDMIQGVTGGINIPMISVMGNAVDLNTTVENLIKLGIVGISSLGGIGQIISGAAKAVTGGSYENLLTKLGIGAYSDTNTITRGTGLESRASGLQTSITTFVGNVEGEDYSASAMGQAMDEANKEQEKRSEEQENPSEDIRDLLLGEDGGENMMQLLADVKRYLASIDDKTAASYIEGMAGAVYGYGAGGQ